MRSRCRNFRPMYGSAGREAEASDRLTSPAQDRPALKKHQHPQELQPLLHPHPQLLLPQPPQQHSRMMIQRQLLSLPPHPQPLSQPQPPPKIPLPLPQQQLNSRRIQIQLQQLPPPKIPPLLPPHPQPQPHPLLELKSPMKRTSKKLFTLHHMQGTGIVLYCN